MKASYDKVNNTYAAQQKIIDTQEQEIKKLESEILSYQKGDMNGDGKVTVEDVTKVIEKVLGK